MGFWVPLFSILTWIRGLWKQGAKEDAAEVYERLWNCLERGAGGITDLMHKMDVEEGMSRNAIKGQLKRAMDGHPRYGTRWDKYDAWIKKLGW